MAKGFSTYTIYKIFYVVCIVYKAGVYTYLLAIDEIQCSITRRRCRVHVGAAVFGARAHTHSLSGSKWLAHERYTEGEGVAENIAQSRYFASSRVIRWRRRRSSGYACRTRRGRGTPRAVFREKRRRGRVFVRLREHETYTNAVLGVCQRRVGRAVTPRTCDVVNVITPTSRP